MWSMSKPLELLQGGANTVLKAHVISSQGNSVRVALVSKSNPTAINLIEV